MNREPVNPDDPEFTAYALGELSAAERAEFEKRLESSPMAKAELESMSEMMSFLSTGLRNEWEEKIASTAILGEPISSDDPELTAYALGELTAAEKAQFEVRLEASPRARRELDSMGEIMSMLSTGLKDEWEKEMAPPMFQVVAEDTETKALREKVIVPTTFRESRRLLGAVAAAVAVMLVAVGVSSIPESGSNAVVASAPLNSVDNSPAVHVPRLLLAEEMDDVSSLAFAAPIIDEPVSADVANPENAEIDASYLDSVSIVPASYNPAAEPALRVDSYLPPVPGNGGKTTQLDLRKGKIFNASDSNGSRVFVRGIVAMDGHGFHPIAMSGNPVVETDLQILSQMRALQSDLDEVISSLPADSAERARLQQISQKSRTIGSDLKREFSR